MTYLMCSYGRGMFEHERAVEFAAINEEGISKASCLVDKSDVIPSDETSGLVRVMLLKIKKEKALIRINDLGDHRQSTYLVPIDDINFSDKLKSL